MRTGIYETLNHLGYTSLATRELFSKGTRDNPNVEVWRDCVSGVIYICDHYVGEEEYHNGQYRADKQILSGAPDFERIRDRDRRLRHFKKFAAGKDICDFGCGAGEFLKVVQPFARSIVGVELQDEYVTALYDAGIACMQDLSDIADASLDVIFSFHTLEHLPHPVEFLNLMSAKLRPGGRVVIEVPHAGDFLLRDFTNCQDFKNFTLWSQHLILHTRGSLAALLGHCGYDRIIVEGVQRYPLSNHLCWLSQGKPGGHKSELSALDSDSLTESYAAALSRIDATDTLIATAVVK